MTIENISKSFFMKVLGQDRYYDPWISNQTHYRLRYRARPFRGSYFIKMGTESNCGVGILLKYSFYSIGAKLYELLIAGLMCRLSFRCISLRRHSTAIVMAYNICQSKVTIVIQSSDIRTKASAVQVICGEKVLQVDLLQPYITS